MYKCISLLTLVIVSGCMKSTGTLKWYENEYRYKYFSAPQKGEPRSYDEQEHMRIQNLNEAMRKESTCPDNFEITERDVWAGRYGVNGAKTGQYKIEYTLRCYS